jgi:hypothetical protein
MPEWNMLMTGLQFARYPGVSAVDSGNLACELAEAFVFVNWRSWVATLPPSHSPRGEVNSTQLTCMIAVGASEATKPILFLPAVFSVQCSVAGAAHLPS